VGRPEAEAELRRATNAERDRLAASTGVAEDEDEPGEAPRYSREDLPMGGAAGPPGRSRRYGDDHGARDPARSGAAVPGHRFASGVRGAQRDPGPAGGRPRRQPANWGQVRSALWQRAVSEQQRLTATSKGAANDVQSPVPRAARGPAYPG